MGFKGFMQRVKQGAMGWGTSAAAQGGRGHRAGVGRIGTTGMAGAYGAVGGAAWGATAGRDPGQSRLGGAFTGALGGAALGAAGYRYGGAAIRSSRNPMRADMYGPSLRHGPITRSQHLTERFGAAGQGAWRQMRGDAAQAKQRIGASLSANGAIGRIRSTLSTAWNG